VGKVILEEVGAVAVAGDQVHQREIEALRVTLLDTRTHSLIPLRQHDQMW